MARAGFLGDYGNRKCHDKWGGEVNIVRRRLEDRLEREGKIEMEKGRRRRLKESGRGETNDT